MGKDGQTFEQWLAEAKIPRRYRAAEPLAVLRAAFDFLEQVGWDYASRRIVGHFLLHCQLGLKLAQVARLVKVTRPTASRQNHLSSREVVGEIQHRLAGRPYGKLLPRYAGPIAQFLVTHPQACREDLLDFIETTWNIRVSLTAVHRFLKKYGLDRQSLRETTPPEPPHLATDERTLLQFLDQPSVSAVPQPPENFFFAATPSMRAPSCCYPKCSSGGRSPSSVSRMTTAHSSVAS
jgi:hypothetical protein